MIEIKNIKKSFGKKAPLAGASFCAENGQCIGILGKNGSGKSTLLSVLAGVLPADGGEFLLDGDDLLKKDKLHASLVGYIPQGTPLLEELSAYDNLLLWYDKKELKKELENGVLKLLGIDEFIKVPVHKMSGGMKKRLSIGCAVAKRPRVLLLDEPSAALDLIAKEQIADYLRGCKKSGNILVLTTHDESELCLCDKWYILKNGVLEEFNYNGDVHELSRRL